jgi:hypothetical protein
MTHYPPRHDVIYELITKCIKDENKKRELKYALQVSLCIEFKSPRKNLPPTIPYEGNFYHYAISKTLTKHLILLKDQNLIPEEVIPMENFLPETCFKISPLVTAIRFENYHMAKELLMAGGDVNECDTYLNESLLVMAASSLNYEMVDLLLKFGANPNSPKNAVDTALCRILHQRFLDYTFDIKPNPNFAPKIMELVELLIQHGANILFPSIQDRIKRYAEYPTHIYQPELFSMLEQESKKRSNFRSNMFLLFANKNNVSAVKEVPKEIFNKVFHATPNG